MPSERASGAIVIAAGMHLYGVQLDWRFDQTAAKDSHHERQSGLHRLYFAPDSVLTLQEGFRAHAVSRWRFNTWFEA